MHAGLSAKVKAELVKMGYVIDERHFGDLNVIINKNGKLDAASEASGRGKSIVF